MTDPTVFFRDAAYIESNERRLEHLASLPLPIERRSVLEVGAGIGDLTPFFLERDCTVTCLEPRPENAAFLRERYAAEPRVRVVEAPLSEIDRRAVGAHQVVFCYGTFGELGDLERAIEQLAAHCNEVLLLEAAVNGDPLAADSEIVHVESDINDLRASIEGRFGVPTRPWIFARLRDLFPYAYVPATQPAFERFRLDWRERGTQTWKFRAIFVASHTPLHDPVLLDELPLLQRAFEPG